MKRIKLTQGKYAIVDNEDYSWLNQWKWYCDSNGYAQRRKVVSFKKSKLISMHRLILNTPKGMQTDHINGDKLDNRRNNLRICTNAENARNKKSTNKSGYKGIYYSKEIKKWVAHLTYNSKHIYIGCFVFSRDAALAYNKKAKELFGEFARLNKV